MNNSTFEEAWQDLIKASKAEEPYGGIPYAGLDPKATGEYFWGIRGLELKKLQSEIDKLKETLKTKDAEIKILCVLNKQRIEELGTSKLKDFNEGYETGHKDGYQEGYDEGYRTGYGES